jgi:hypothetical protein
MSVEYRKVGSLDELCAAVGDTGVREIELTANLTEVPTLRLSPGQTLRASTERKLLRFAPGQDGLQLSTDNRLEGLDLHADAHRCALFNDSGVGAFGTFALRHLGVHGAVRLLVREQVRAGHVKVDGLDIAAADARGYDVRPKGFGVEVVPGAFTLWNQQDDPDVTITAEIEKLSVGRAGAPVLGSGVFVSGAGPSGGRVVASRLETGSVYSDGKIALGTADRISGGVFVVHGAYVDTVRNCGPVTTFGPNDMVLDNWGFVERWIADGKITSYGPSGIGFVNFGTVDALQINAPIETFGQGARGFNVYSGTVHSAEFERIVTHDDGAVGIQISRPVGDIKVRRGIATYGRTGNSLVKGVAVTLSAIPLSIKPGGSARRIEVAGGLAAHGEGIIPLELLGDVDVFQVSDGFSAAGGNKENS